MKDEQFLKIAIEEAQCSDKDVPVGALLVINNEIIAKAHNKKELNNDPVAHAEMLVISEACRKINNWRLENAVLYVTLEPCPMCAAAVLYSRIPKIVFGAYDNMYGALGSVINMSNYIKHNPVIIGGVLENECSQLLKNFFQKQRRR